MARQVLMNESAFRASETVYMSSGSESWKGTEAQAIKEGRMSEESTVWREGYLYRQWNRLDIARIAMPEEPVVRCDWYFFDSVDGSVFGHTDPRTRIFRKDRDDIEILVPQERLLTAGAIAAIVKMEA